MNLDNVDFTGFVMASLGWFGTLLGAAWNLESMQIISFLFAAFAGFGTGVYYISKSFVEWYRVIKVRAEVKRLKKQYEEDEDEDEEPKPNNNESI